MFFEKMQTRKNDGFTLVELIVVIAILAILAGIGVPAYTGYVEKANMAADQQLISEIKNTALLAVYDNYQTDLTGNVVVKVTTSGTSVSGAANDAAIVEEAMNNTFGEGEWAGLKLKYTDWQGSAGANVAAYQESSFNGKEESLVNKMGSLSGAMANFFGTGGRNVPSHIEDVLTANNVDTTNPTALANGALVALSNSISSTSNILANPEDTSSTKTIQDEISEALSNMPNTCIKFDEDTGLPYADMSDTTTALSAAYAKVYGTGKDAEDMVTLATAATLYAYAEAYSQYAADNENNAPAAALDGIKFDTNASGTAILGQIVGAFDTIMNGAIGDANASAYFENGQAGKDANAFFSVMGALSDSSEALEKNLTSETFYSDGTAVNLITSYITVGGQIATGEAAVIVTPNRTVTAYLGGLL